MLTPSRIGALAATGHRSVEVFARPTVAILSTGNEIADPGEALKPGQIYDINRFTISTIVQEHGGVATRFATAQDTVDALERALQVMADFAHQPVAIRLQQEIVMVEHGLGVAFGLRIARMGRWEQQ